MRITILTISPELLQAAFGDRLLSFPLDRDSAWPAWEGIRVLDVRDMVRGSFRAVDDSPYGGGAGMIVRCEPVVEALKVLGVLDKTGKRTAGRDQVRVIALSPAGRVYNAQEAEMLKKVPHIVLICGHYEGLDQRIYHYCDEIYSIGDYVLSGGELAAMVICDTLIR